MTQKEKKDRLAVCGRIRQARKVADLTQWQVAELLGVSEQTVRNWEKGFTVCEKHEHLDFFARKSGYSIDYLTGAVDDPQGSRTDNIIKNIESQLERTMTFLQRVSKYRFIVTDDFNEIEILEYNQDKKAIEKIIQGKQIIMDRNDITTLFDIINRSVAGIVESYLEHIVIPKAIGRNKFLDAPELLKRYGSPDGSPGKAE